MGYQKNLKEESGHFDLKPAKKRQKVKSAVIKMKAGFITASPFFGVILLGDSIIPSESFNDLGKTDRPANLYTSPLKATDACTIRTVEDTVAEGHSFAVLRPYITRHYRFSDTPAIKRVNERDGRQCGIFQAPCRVSHLFFSQREALF